LLNKLLKDLLAKWTDLTGRLAMWLPACEAVPYVKVEAGPTRQRSVQYVDLKATEINYIAIL